MKDLAENNLIRFKNISKKKEAIFANFKVKGVRGGVNFSASITVDISAAEVHAGDVFREDHRRMRAHRGQRIQARRIPIRRPNHSSS